MWPSAGAMATLAITTYAIKEAGGLFVQTNGTLGAVAAIRRLPTGDPKTVTYLTLARPIASPFRPGTATWSLRALVLQPAPAPPRAP